MPTAVAGLAAALPSGGGVKGDEGTEWAGLVPSRVDGAGGISAPGVPAGSRPWQGTGAQRDPGDEYPSGRFVLPGRTGTEGHSCCGCHRAPTASREEMGAARAPTSHPGGCAWSQPVAARPVPAPSQAGQVPGAQPGRLPKGKATRGQLRSASNLWVLTSPVAGLQSGGSFWEPTVA